MNVSNPAPHGPRAVRQSLAQRSDLSVRGNHATHILDLPPELIGDVLKRLDFKDQQQLTSTCRSLRQHALRNEFRDEYHKRRHAHEEQQQNFNVLSADMSQLVQQAQHERWVGLATFVNTIHPRLSLLPIARQLDVYRTLLLRYHNALDTQFGFHQIPVPAQRNAYRSRLLQLAANDDRMKRMTLNMDDRHTFPMDMKDPGNTRGVLAAYVIELHDQQAITNGLPHEVVDPRSIYA